MDLNNIVEINKNLRLKALELYKKANAGHIACSLSCMDLVSYFVLFEKKESEDFILSKGHAAVSLYVSLNKAALISDNDLNSFYEEGTKLPAHPAPDSFKGIPFATGSLGHGLPIANGLAKSNKLNGSNDFTYVLMSDGETNEGSNWEAASFAVQHKLNKLLVIIDKNKIQGFGKTNDVLGDTAKLEVWSKIGFDVQETDGHNIIEINSKVNYLKSLNNNKPKLLIANTIKGKGVSFMENTVDWHYWPMNKDQYNKAVNEVLNM